MSLSQKTKNFITIVGSIVGIALTGINIGRSIGI